MKYNAISKIVLGGVLIMPTLSIASEYIIRAPVDADLSQWQVMPPIYGNWEETSEPYSCTNWTPDSFSFLVGESFDQTQSCLQDFERTVTYKEYDSFSGEEVVISTETESDTQTIENERIASGTRSILPPESSGWVDVNEPYECSEWTPHESTVAEGVEFIQTQSCLQDQEETITVYAEDISTGQREIESQETNSHTITVTHEQDNVGTKVVRNMCVDILNRGESNGNGVYNVSPDGVNYRKAYCDMSGGGWSLFDSFGTQLVNTGGANPASYNAQSINSVSAAQSAGYTTHIEYVNHTNYHTSAYYMQYFFGGANYAYIQKVMPSWAKDVKVALSNQWIASTTTISYGSSSKTAGANAPHAEYTFSGGGQLLKVRENGGLVWIDSVWVK